MKALQLLVDMKIRYDGLKSLLGTRFQPLMDLAVDNVLERAKLRADGNEVLAALDAAKEADALAEKATTWDERQGLQLNAQLYAVVPIALMERETGEPRA